MSKPFLRKEGSSPKVTEMMGEDGDNSSPDTSIVEEVQKQGSLRRKIGSFAKWKKAFFVLHNSGALMEFGSSEEVRVLPSSQQLE